jgi:hypothetical protein
MASKLKKKFRHLNKLTYPIRPWLTLALGGTAIAIGIFLGPAAWPVGWIGANFMIDDLMNFPLLQAHSSIHNLSDRYKRQKSILKLVIMLLGAGLAVALLPMLPFFGAVVAGVLTQIPSIIIMATCITAGVGIAKYFNVSPLMGLMIGSLIPLFIPLTLPIMAETLFCASIIGAFGSSLLGKTVLQKYYEHTYGHANADGNFLLDPAVQNDPIKKAINDCLIEIKRDVHQECSFWDNFTGKEKSIISTLSDVQYLVARAQTPEELEMLATLLTDMRAVWRQNEHIDSTGFALFKLQSQQHKTLGETRIVKEAEALGKITMSKEYLFNRNPQLVNDYHQRFFKQHFEAALAKYKKHLEKQTQRQPVRLDHAIYSFQIQ